MMSFVANQTAFAEALLDPARSLPDGITGARGVADPLRFAVYRNNVFVGLTNALATRFPVTRRLVGEQFFTGMARVYAGLEKPGSPLMFEYGDSFADFIAGFSPAQELAYLPDIARIEAAWTRAYHAADSVPLGVTDLAALSPQTIAELRPAAHASATLISSPHPAGSIWVEHQTESVGQVQPAAETVLVVRPAMEVKVHILPAQDSAFAQAIFDGQPLREAARRVLAVNAGFDFGAALVGLTTLGAFASFQKDTMA